MRILFITKGSFGSNDATGSMLNNVFDGMSDTKVLQFSLRPHDPKESTPIPLVSILPNVRYSIFYCMMVLGDRKLNKGLSYKIWRIIRSVLFFLDIIAPTIITKREYKGIKDFAPDVIYTLAANVKVLRVSRLLAKRLNISIVIHNMDDYYNMDGHSSHLMKRVYNNLLRKEYRLAYCYSRKSLAIGPKMADEYSETFKLPFDWVMNCVKEDDIKEVKTLSESISLIIFSGGLHGGRANTLAAIADYLDTVHGVRMEIYTGKPDMERYSQLFEKYDNTSLHGYVVKEKMFDNLSRADVLLHVESFEPQYIRYFRLSMSTKLPEYMAIGRPILCIGPREIATVAFIKSFEVGYVISEISEIGSAFKELSKREIRVKLADNAHHIVTTVFIQKAMQGKLKSVLTINSNRIG